MQNQAMNMKIENKPWSFELSPCLNMNSETMIDDVTMIHILLQQPWNANALIIRKRVALTIDSAVQCGMLSNKNSSHSM